MNTASTGKDGGSGCRTLDARPDDAPQSHSTLTMEVYMDRKLHLLESFAAGRIGRRRLQGLGTSAWRETLPSSAPRRSGSLPAWRNTARAMALHRCAARRLDAHCPLGRCAACCGRIAVQHRLHRATSGAAGGPERHRRARGCATAQGSGPAPTHRKSQWLAPCMIVCVRVNCTPPACPTAIDSASVVESD